MRTLKVDSVTAAVVTAFRRAGLRSILLKGPTISGWLYAAGERTYVDSDLLVDPREFGRAESVLQDLGFSTPLTGWSRLAHGWERHDGAQVDLHRAIEGVLTSKERAWAILSRHAEEVDVAGLTTEALAPAARLVHLGLHAAQHPGTDQPREDLHRALETCSQELWLEAATLAAELEATDAFAFGLRQDDRASRLADDLGLPRKYSAKSRLLDEKSPPGAHTLAEVASGRSPGAKAALALEALFPRPAYMRSWSQMARRGRIGFVLAYLVRPFVVAVRLGPAVAGYLRARRAATHDSITEAPKEQVARSKRVEDQAGGERGERK